MKQFSLATLTLLCAAATLSADSMGNKQSKTAQPMVTTQPTSQITPTANPMVTHWADPYVTADFIWWKANEDGLDFSYDGASTTSGVSAGKGHVHGPKFKYEPGFKVGFGLKFMHDGWDLYGNYTWFRTTFNETRNRVATKSTSSQISDFAVQNTQPTSVNILSSSKGEWSLHFNALDLELGRNFWISQWLTLRPHFGMKFSWNRQNYNASFDNITAFQGTAVTAGSNLKDTNKLHQFGVGIRTGMDAAYYIWKPICIFGEFAYTGMWNSIHAKRTDKIVSPTGSSTTNLNTKNHTHPMTSILELSLGLRYEQPFSNDDYLFMLQAGWEQQFWFNQNRFFFIGNRAPTDMTLQGLTVKAGLDF